MSTPWSCQLHHSCDEGPDSWQAVPDGEVVVAEHGGLQYVVNIIHAAQLLDVVVADLSLPRHGGEEGELLDVGQGLAHTPDIRHTLHTEGSSNAIVHFKNFCLKGIMKTEHHKVETKSHFLERTVVIIL